MKDNFRHGDMGLFIIKELPEGLKRAKTKVIMTGSGGNNHSFDNGKLYFKKTGDFVIGYLEAENTTLFHKEHGKKVKGRRLRQFKLPDGIYEIRKQAEIVNEEIRPVID